MGWELLKNTFKAKQFRPLTSYEKETLWRYEDDGKNGDAQGLGNGREMLWDMELVNQQLAELHGRSDSKESESEFDALPESEQRARMAALLTEAHWDAEAARLARKERWARFGEERLGI